MPYTKTEKPRMRTKTLLLALSFTSRKMRRSGSYYNCTQHIAVAMSGGIDSAATAFLLKTKGFNVVGVFLKSWDVSDEGGKPSNCTYDRDKEDMQQVCKRLGIIHYEVDLVKEYWNDVFTPFLDLYKSGLRTPNPDVLCNRFVKFHHLRKFISKQLGISKLATGHYARIIQHKNNMNCPLLLRGVDPVKDQSFFLSLVKGDDFQDVLMPLGEFHKREVRQIVAEPFKGLRILSKKESMGICFIGKRSMPEFLSNYIPLRHGRFIDMDTGEVLGQHKGVETLTIGQGANISGKTDRYFVAAKVVVEGRGDVCVVKGAKHPALYSNSLCIPLSHFNWISGQPPLSLLLSSEETKIKMHYKLRNTDPLKPCMVSCAGGKDEESDVKDMYTGLLRRNDYAPERSICSFQIQVSLKIDFLFPQRAVTPGQVFVLYDDDVCLGGGIV